MEYILIMHHKVESVMTVDPLPLLRKVGKSRH